MGYELPGKARDSQGSLTAAFESLEGALYLLSPLRAEQAAGRYHGMRGLGSLIQKKFRTRRKSQIEIALKVYRSCTVLCLAGYPGLSGETGKTHRCMLEAEKWQR